MTIAELKADKRWFLWNYSPGNNGKVTKVPMSAFGGKTGTSEEYKQTWVDFQEASRAKEKYMASGIGFVIPKGMYFFDIDGRPIDDPFVSMMLERFASYAEKSPSGNGIHVLGNCNDGALPFVYDAKKNRYTVSQEFYQKNPNNHIELYFGYATNRYATFTGDVINNLDLTDGTQASLITLDKDMRRKPKVNYSESRDGDRDEFDIVCYLRKQKNGEKFKRLYDDGDWSSCGYGSQSEADAGLCGMIAFRTGPNPDAIDSIFRTSALYRPKWERDDYRTSTIELGIESCHGCFHKSQMEHPYFIKFDERTGAPKLSVPLLAKYTREHMKYILVRDNGKQAMHKYIYENGCYKYYADNMVMGRIKQYIAEYDEELVSMGKVSETLSHINTDLNYVAMDELNANEDIINFQNTLLKISASELVPLPHDPEVYSTIQVPCNWTGKPSPTPVFDSYIEMLTDGNKDVEQLLLEVLGVCISNIKGYRMKKALFMIGEGDTGKSQLKSLTEKLLGKGNFIGIDLKEIESRFGTGAVYNTRLAGSSDMSFLSVDELKTFKKMTGGDSLFAEFKGQQAFEFTYGGFLWFCMNRLPKFGGDDGKWVYDRIMVVECKNVIPKGKQDKELLEKMYSEREGIVYKAVKALQTVMANGYRFSEPDCVTRAREKYQTENNTVISFFEDCMCEREGGKITDACTTGKIYKVYEEWCRDINNGFAKTYKEFRNKIADHLSTTFEEMIVKRNNGTFYKYYTLTAECKKDYQQVYGFDSTDFLA